MSRHPRRIETRAAFFARRPVSGSSGSNATRRRDRHGRTKSRSDAADIEWTVHLANRKATGFRMLQQRRRGVIEQQVSTRPTRHSSSIPGRGPSLRWCPAAIFDSGSVPRNASAVGRDSFRDQDRTPAGAGRKRSVRPSCSRATRARAFRRQRRMVRRHRGRSRLGNREVEGDGSTPAVSGARVDRRSSRLRPRDPELRHALRRRLPDGPRQGLVPRPSTFSFMRFVHPILMRASGYQWVNAAAAARHGGSAQMNFAASMDLIRRSPGNRCRFDVAVFSVLRDPRGTATDAVAGHAAAVCRGRVRRRAFRAACADANPIRGLARWATVPDTPPDFVWDSPRDPWARQSLPDALDRVALEACAGGAFFPGIEAPRLHR